MPTLFQINVCANRGSTGRIAEQIGELAISRGWESYIAYGRGVGQSKLRTIKVGTTIGVFVHALLTRLTDRHGLFSSAATRRLVRRIHQIKPDIVHLHNIHGYYLNYKILFDYLRQENIPVVWTLHDCWSMTGHCTHFEMAKCDRWKSGCYDCPEKLAYPRSILLDSSRKNYAEKREAFSSVENLTLVPVSNWLRGVVKESYLKGCDAKVICNGVDTDIFKPAAENNLLEQYNIPRDKKIILGVATIWNDYKGFGDFAKLYELLPKDRYQIVMIGLTQNQQNRIPKGVIGLQRTENVEALARWYSAADVFVNPTYEDTYPTTNLESISCGTPVVTYKTGGSPESLTTNTGCVVEKGDIAGVAQAIEELCSEDRNEICERCREYAVAHFDKKDCFDNYLELYERILTSR